MIDDNMETSASETAPAPSAVTSPEPSAETLAVLGEPDATANLGLLYGSIMTMMIMIALFL